MTFPLGLPYRFGGTSTTTRLRFESAILSVVPPWLRRTVGGKVMAAFGSVLDDLVDRNVASVRARFPGEYDDALPYLGRDRVITRGPNEPASTYSARLLRWWDDHKTRGGPYAMLNQLAAYTSDSPYQIDLVYHSGTRRTLNADGTITRDSITWGADGTALWAQAWLFHRLSADPGTLTAEQEEQYKSIPRDWNAAHVLPIHVVLVWGYVRLWNYPQPVATWAVQGAAMTWADMAALITFDAE